MKMNPVELDLRGAHRVSTVAISPRPIAFVSTIGEDGVFNLAPFSSVSPLSVKPLLISVSIVPRRNGVTKDTLKNIQYSKEFVINVVTEDMAEAMNKTAAPYPSSVDEFKEVGLTPVPSDIIRPPRVKESPINLECRLFQILPFGQGVFGCHLIVGEVVMIHVKDELFLDGEIKVPEVKVIGRLGGDFYCRTTDRFEMKRPEGGSVD